MKSLNKNVVKGRG